MTQHDHNHQSGGHSHHSLPEGLAIRIFAALIVLTIITVAVAHIDLGIFNIIVALLVATVKASLVCLFFMGLKYDRKENGVIFATSFLFLAIFLALTANDLFNRGDVYVKPGDLKAKATGGGKLVRPWLSSPETLARGKELFGTMCVACHGPAGHGDGPGAAALNPKPRNFTSGDGWKNGRKVTQVFGTLSKGLPPNMPPFDSLPAEDRLALAQYILSLGPAHPADTNEELVKAGIDPTKERLGDAATATIPVDVAMEIMTVKAVDAPPHGSQAMPASLMGRYYVNHCSSCHGARAEGARAQNVGYQGAFVITQNLRSVSLDRFTQVLRGPHAGGLAPAAAELSSSDLSELVTAIKALQTN